VAGEHTHDVRGEGSRRGEVDRGTASSPANRRYYWVEIRETEENPPSSDPPTRPFGGILNEGIPRALGGQGPLVPHAGFLHMAAKWKIRVWFYGFGHESLRRGPGGLG
jgi:hypothetical protein